MENTLISDKKFSIFVGNVEKEIIMNYPIAKDYWVSRLL